MFVSPGDLAADAAVIGGEAHHHLVHVLRVRVGEHIALLDGLGGAWEAMVEGADRRALRARLVGPLAALPEPAVGVTVAQALGKGDRFEQVVQHATEMGAAAFVPLVTQRTVVRIDPRDVEAKRARWRQIARGAAEQAGRARVPVVEPPATLETVAGRFGEFGAAILLHPEAPRLGALASGTESVLLLVGPEGGFAPNELERAAAAGARLASLGLYVLRTETAALAALSRILA